MESLCSSNPGFTFSRSLNLRSSRDVGSNMILSAFSSEESHVRDRVSDTHVTFIVDTEPVFLFHTVWKQICMHTLSSCHLHMARWQSDAFSTQFHFLSRCLLTAQWSLTIELIRSSHYWETVTFTCYNHMSDTETRPLESGSKCVVTYLVSICNYNKETDFKLVKCGMFKCVINSNLPAKRYNWLNRLCFYFEVTHKGKFRQSLLFL